MRILESQIYGRIDQQSHRDESQLNLAKSRQTHTRLGEGQQVIGIQETVNLDYSRAYESEQSSRLYTHSTILNPDQGMTQTISQEEVTSKLVSGVLQHRVHIGDTIYANAGMADASLGGSFANELGINNELNLSSLSGGDSIANAAELSVNERRLVENSDSLTLISEGEIATSDGQVINFRLELDLESNYREVIEQDLLIRSEEFVDPLVISLDGRVPSLSDATFTFDLDSDGKEDRLSSLSSGAGFLAFDRNGDGVVNNGKELFGPQSGNGYADLAAFDENNDGWIDSGDAIFNQLLVWQPGIEGREGQLQSLRSLGLGAISLQSLESPFVLRDERNNALGVVQRSGIFLRENGEVGLVQQIDLVIQPENSEGEFLEVEFHERATELQAHFQQYVAEKGAAGLPQVELSESLLNQVMENIPALRLEAEPEEIELEPDSLPMLILISHFKIDVQQEEKITEQSMSERMVTNELNSSVPQEGVGREEEEVQGVARIDRFNVASQHDLSSLESIKTLSAERQSVTISIIEEVLKPLYERILLKRQQASELYRQGLKD